MTSNNSKKRMKFLIKSLFSYQYLSLIYMSYLNAEALEKSILGKSVIVGDPVRIQEVPNMENVQGLKLKNTAEEWANSENCVICKQPFNQARKVNRHHCRICGGSACGQCSRKKVNNERVCDFCFLKLHLKKQQHQRKEQFRQREQNIAKMTKQTKQFEQQIDHLQKQIHDLQKGNLALELQQGTIITQKQQAIKKKTEQLAKRAQQLEKKKKQYTERKAQLQTREDRNKMYSAKVQIIKLDISSKQAALLQKMQELEKLKAQLEKLETQKQQLMKELND